MSHPKRRFFRAPATAAVAALTAAFLVPFGVLAAAPAAAATGECAPGFLPGPGTPAENDMWTDDNVAVFAGGDFVADGGAAESEGLLVAMGDATFDKAVGGRFNVGWVGVGSQTAPTPGSVMLAVGGALTVGETTVLDVGSGAADAGGDLLGGDVRAGGTTSPLFPAPQYELNNGSLEASLGAASVSAWADFDDALTANSASWVAMADTNPVVVSGARATFAGDGTSGLQVFTVTAAQLNAIAEISFTGIADDAPVVINVVGDQPITFSPNYFENDGVRADDLSSPLFGVVAQRTMWNFADTTSVTFGGTSQFLGSVLAPHADFGITASMNGRVYAGGDILMNGDGNELHNYPWLAPGAFACIADSQTGSFEIVKSVSGDDAPDVAFSGEWACFVGGVEAVSGTWSARAGETAGPFDAPVGAECSVTETGPADTDEGTWAAPVISGAPASITARSADDPITVTVANTWVPSGIEPTPTPTPTPTPMPTPTPSPTEPAPAPTAPDAGDLAVTGSTVPWWVLAVGGGLVLAGGAAVVVTLVRRRRP